MAIFTAETARLLARELYGYELGAEAAAALAGSGGAMMTLIRQLPAPPEQVQPPFGYPALVAESEAAVKERR